MRSNPRKGLGDDRGASLVEYALLVSLVAVLALTAVMLAGARVSETFDGVATQMDSTDLTGTGDNTGDQDSGNPGIPGGGDPDPGNPSDNHPGNPGTPGGSDLDPGNPGGDDQNDPGQPGGDDHDNPGQSGDEEKPPGSSVEVSASDSDFYWWNDTRQGGEGEWKAAVTFTNDTDRHQYLDLVLVITDHSADTKTVKVSGFYVPANGSSTYEHWSNALKLVNGKLIGVMTIEFKVDRIVTSDKNWKPVTFELGGETVAKVVAPTP